jgi:hypothetical protein
MKKILIGLLTLCSFLNTARAELQEDDIFDAHRLAPAELLYQAYQQSRVLLIGTSNHTNFQHYNHLLELLEIVGNDPDLKYIVMERSYEVSGFYELLSTLSFESAMKQFKFTPERTLTDNLCLNPEWSYTIKEFMPKLRKINRLRGSKRPILLKTIEGMPADLSAGSVPGVKDGNCSATIFNNFSEMELNSLSLTREIKTQKNFEKSIWNDLGPNEKVIIVSHYMHLIDGFKGCRPSMDDQGNWTANIEPLTWLTPFFSSHPNVKKDFKLILIDEKDWGYNPNGGLKLVQRQAHRYPEEDFAFFTKPFEIVSRETGASMFVKDATINRRENILMHTSEKKLDELFDGVIWNAKSDSLYLLRTAHEYLPNYCKP